MQGKVLINIDRRRVGTTRLLWNRLTPTRGGSDTRNWIAEATRTGDVHLSVRNEGLIINNLHEFQNSRYYANCLERAGVADIIFPKGFEATEVGAVLDALSDRPLRNAREILVSRSVELSTEKSFHPFYISDRWRRPLQKVSEKVINFFSIYYPIMQIGLMKAFNTNPSQFDDQALDRLTGFLARLLLSQHLSIGYLKALDLGNVSPEYYPDGISSMSEIQFNACAIARALDIHFAYDSSSHLVMGTSTEIESEIKKGNLTYQRTTLPLELKDRSKDDNVLGPLPDGVEKKAEKSHGKLKFLNMRPWRYRIREKLFEGDLDYAAKLLFSGHSPISVDTAIQAEGLRSVLARLCEVGERRWVGNYLFWVAKWKYGRWQEDRGAREFFGIVYGNFSDKEPLMGFCAPVTNMDILIGPKRLLDILLYDFSRQKGGERILKNIFTVASESDDPKIFQDALLHLKMIIESGKADKEVKDLFKVLTKILPIGDCRISSPFSDE